MALGAGKYDHLATLVRQRTGARTVIVAVIDGDQGSGFSVQTVDPRMTRALPAMLRDMAEEIDRSAP